MQYTAIGLACVATVAVLLVYQNTDSKQQSPSQDVIKTEENLQTIKPNYTTQISTPIVQSTTQKSLDISLLEQDIHEIANKARAPNGIQPVGYDSNLADIARAHSQDMAAHQFFSHYSYNGTGLNHRYAFSGYTCKVQVGAYAYSTSNENIAVVTAQGNEMQIAQHIVDTWLGNTADRGNIFDTEHKVEGIGVALTSNKMAVYATEDFC
jgi:uncharacterized protein YkwD